MKATHEHAVALEEDPETERIVDELLRKLGSSIVEPPAAAQEIAKVSTPAAAVGSGTFRRQETTLPTCSTPLSETKRAMRPLNGLSPPRTRPDLLRLVGSQFSALPASIETRPPASPQARPTQQVRHPAPEPCDTQLPSHGSSGNFKIVANEDPQHQYLVTTAETNYVGLYSSMQHSLRNSMEVLSQLNNESRSRLRRLKARGFSIDSRLVKTEEGEDVEG